MDNWPKIAVVGAGAVGCYFGGMLARAGAPVTLVRRPRRAAAEAVGASPRPVGADGSLLIDSVHFQATVRVKWAAEPHAVCEAELVLFSVKTVDTEEAARQIAPHLAPATVVVSLQNGVDNVERIRAASGIEALPAVVYVAAAMASPDRVKHSGRGDLVIGALTNPPNGESQESKSENQPRHIGAKVGDRIGWVAETFARAGVPCRITDNIEGELWVKLILNCAGNAVTALGRASYGRVARHELARQVVTATANEAIAVARAAGIQLPPGDLVGAGLKLAEQLGEATSSTAQDIACGKRTEIDSLNGAIARRGAELGVPTPVNHTLFALVKLLEESR